MKIFVIDDEPMFRETIKDFVESKFPGNELFVFDSGEDALQNIIRKPDLVILDYNLDSNDRSAENGIEILKKIKALLPDLPVIILSGQDSPMVAADTIKYGAYDYIIKNENAYNRLQLFLDKILGYNKLNKRLGFQRFMNYILAIIMAALIIGIIIWRFGQ